jgi:hypothetical protein
MFECGSGARVRSNVSLVSRTRAIIRSRRGMRSGHGDHYNKFTLGAAVRMKPFSNSI